MPVLGFFHFDSLLIRGINFFHEQVRAMFDDRGGRVDEAGPSMAVQVSFSVLVLIFFYHHESNLNIFEILHL